MNVWPRSSTRSSSKEFPQTNPLATLFCVFGSTPTASTAVIARKRAFSISIRTRPTAEPALNHRQTSRTPRVRAYSNGYGPKRKVESLRTFRPRQYTASPSAWLPAWRKHRGRSQRPRSRAWRKRSGTLLPTNKGSSRGIFLHRLERTFDLKIGIHAHYVAGKRTGGDNNEQSSGNRRIRFYRQPRHRAASGGGPSGADHGTGPEARRRGARHVEERRRRAR